MKTVKKIKEDNGNGDQSNESEPSISENENTNQIKILLPKSTTDLLSFTALAFRKTRRLDSPPNLTNRNKRKESRK